MKLFTHISKGGQVTVPASVRKRWATSRIVVEDEGERLIIRPIPEDPVGAAIGSIPLGDLRSEDMRAETRSEEEEAERHKYG